MNPRYRNVYYNRDVYRRPINYRNVDRYAGVHRHVYIGDRRDGDRGRGDRTRDFFHRTKNQAGAELLAEALHAE